MKHGKMITRWNGYLPVVEDMPEQENIKEKIENLMYIVWKIGAAGKAKKECIEV